MDVVGIDPGNSHHGIVHLRLRGPKVELVAVAELNDQTDLYNYVKCWDPDVLVIEEWRLYPFQARNQGFSDFPTAQTIGALKYIADQIIAEVAMQKAMVKKQARTMAAAQGLPMKTRSLGSGKGAYRGPDFDPEWLKLLFGCKSSQHIRDALAHACFWVWTDPASPARLGTDNRPEFEPGWPSAPADDKIV